MGDTALKLATSRRKIDKDKETNENQLKINFRINSKISRMLREWKPQRNVSTRNQIT